MNQEQWVYDAEGNGSCRRHPSEPGFVRGEPCFACASDPGPRIDVAAAAIEDVEARAVEAEVRSAAKTCKRLADEAAAGEGRDLLLAPKFYDSFAKLTRLWNEMHSERMQNEADERREELAKRLSGIRGHN